MSGHKPPKQFYHWLKQFGIKRVDRTQTGKYYFKSKQRHFRIDCLGCFDASESFETFDRWANSCLLTHDRIPKTKEELEEFLNFVELAQEAFNDRRKIDE